MIYSCVHCGFRSYHQGEVKNPFCPECRLNKSEVVPMPGEFKARVRSDIDHERFLNGVAGIINSRGGIEKYLQKGDNVTVSLVAHIKIPGVPGTAKCSFDEAMEILEIPDEYGPSIFTEAVKKMRALPKPRVFINELISSLKFDESYIEILKKKAEEHNQAIVTNQQGAFETGKFVGDGSFPSTQHQAKYSREEIGDRCLRGLLTEKEAEYLLRRLRDAEEETDDRFVKRLLAGSGPSEKETHMPTTHIIKLIGLKEDKDNRRSLVEKLLKHPSASNSWKDRTDNDICSGFCAWPEVSQKVLEIGTKKQTIRICPQCYKITRKGII